jgi:transcription factor AP-4
MSPNPQLDQDKRVRRAIANSNERRRMQSINTGFQSLKILIPHSCGEKLSKVWTYLSRKPSKECSFK